MWESLKSASSRKDLLVGRGTGHQVASKLDRSWQEQQGSCRQAPLGSESWTCPGVPRLVGAAAQAKALQLRQGVGCEVSGTVETQSAVGSLTPVFVFMSHCLLPLSKEMRDSTVEVLSAWWGQLTQTCLLPSLGELGTVTWRQMREEGSSP